MERMNMKNIFKSEDDYQAFFEGLQEYFKENRVLEDMYKYNMSFYSKLFENAANYFKYSTKALERFVNAYNQYSRSTKDKENIFPANGHDIFNYVARYNMSNLQIQTILKFDGNLDFEKLKRAVRLSVDAEPIFKCRFVEDDPPYWKRMENIGVINFCSMEETDDIDQAIEAFIQSPLDLDNDPMVKVKLIRSEQYDVIGIKINHACCDGGGVLEYIRFLAEIYSKIDKEDDNLILEPRIGGRKDQDRLFAELGITDPDLLFSPGSDISLPMWPFPWQEGGSNTACMVVKRLPHGYLEKIRRYARSKHATVNDLILTAYYRAMLDMGQPIYGLPMEIPITVDLRRYLPDHKTHAIRNFSGSEKTRLTMLIDEPFDETLQRVSNMMKKIKEGYPGLQSAIGLERLEKISFHDTLAYYQVSPESRKSSSFCPLYHGDKCVPSLSNLGYISESIIRFGDKTVNDAYILPPVVRAPGLLLMACSYNSVLTLAAGYYKYTVSGKDIEKLVNRIRDELIETCKDDR